MKHSPRLRKVKTAGLLCMSVPVCLSVLALSAACSDGGQRAALPRPVAWPRTVVCDTIYTTVQGLPAQFDVNTGARVVIKEGENPGVDIVYPEYNAVIYLTVIPGLRTPEHFQSVWDGRKERVERNIGGVPVNTVRVQNEGFHCALVTARAATQTPVQLLAGDINNGVIVSATAFFNTTVTAANYDSIAPVAKALAIDMERLASTLTSRR